MRSYTTLRGEVLDLSSLSERELVFLRRCYAAYRDNMLWADFDNLVNGTENPILAATGGLITRQVLDHPLYRAAHDLVNRVWITQGKLRLAPGENPNTLPLAEEPLPVSGARAG